jgi:hypothetical protein
MKDRRFLLPLAILFLLLITAFAPSGLVSAQSAVAIYGRVVDANTGLPISNATILIWDLNTLASPKIGAGIYFTDENGEYNATAPYVREGHTYYVFAYKGDFTKKPAEVAYVPSMVKNVYIEYEEKREISFSLIPGALIEISDSPYIVQSPNPETLRSTIKVLPKEKINVSFIDEYGDSSDVWWLRLGRNLVVIPADVPVTLEAKIWFFTGRVGDPVDSKNFLIYNGSAPFLLPQGGRYSFSLSQTSLNAGIEFLKSKLFVEVSSKVDRAQDVGFVVFDERRLLTGTYKNIIEARALLANVKKPEEYIDVWTKLREAFGTLNFISATLDNKKLIGMTNAVYLPAVMAAFSTTLAFFLFEKEKRKILSSIVIFIFYSVLLYFFHPGAHIIIEENVNIFLSSAAISFAGVSLLVFGLPRVWRERSVEGKVPWRSAFTIIFSMGKRQIKRRKIRGFFTILSITILILAFTSLTSFGTVFGIISEEVGTNAPSDGVIVKRIMNRTSLLFSPLGTSNREALSKLVGTISKLIEIERVTLRLKNLPSSSPVIRLINPNGGRAWFIYGVLGIDPVNEAYYTDIEEAVEGDYLSEAGLQGVLISKRVAQILRADIGDRLLIEVLGTHVLANFTVKGFIDDNRYMNLVDMDGSPYGPVRILEDGTSRACNSTEVIVMPLNDAIRLQELVNARYPERPPQILVLSEIIFQPKETVNINSMVETLIFIFNYDVFISERGRIIYYHIGSYLEMKGAIELLIPLVMVGLNVGTVMLNSIYERRKEIRTLSMIGLNPTHIGLIFVAEAIILGMVGGSLGYVVGLGFYRIMNLLGQNLMVREKLEWWWSAIGFALAMAASVLSSLRPAALAVSTYTPSKIKRIKRSQEEIKAREEEIFRVFQARELSMPIKVALNEVLFFTSFCLDRLRDLKLGIIERAENIEETPEIENVKGELVRKINFEYVLSVSGQERRTKNSLVLTKSPDEDYYRVSLVSEPAVLGLPESTIERTVDLVHKIIMDWAKDKESIISRI